MKEVLLVSDPLPPYQWIDDEGFYNGFDYEVISAAFFKCGIRVKLKLYP